MDALGRLRRLGFRKWYERQLVEGHLYLVTCFLCMILVAACVEQFSFRAPGLTPFVMLGWIFGGGLVGLFSWRRYKNIMVVAERYGDHSHCPHCGAYGRFDVLDAGRALHEEPASIAEPDEVWLKVRCRKCGGQWTI